MLHRLNHRTGHYLLFLAASAALFLVNLGGPSLWDADEGRNAGCAYEMLVSGNYLVPTFNAELRVDKPPLLYWLEVAAYRLLGIHELAARLPSALAAFLTVLLVYELGRSLFDRATGLLAALLFATTPMVCASARFANPDALLNLFTVLALLVTWLGYAKMGRLLFVPMGLASALAVLAKGPVGLLVPGTVLLAFLIWARKVRMLLAPARLIAGCLAFAFVALPWYILVGVETKGAFLHGFLWDHNLGRFQSPMEHHGGGPFYYLLVLLVGFAPWSAFLGLALWHGVRGERRPAAPEPASTAGADDDGAGRPRPAPHPAYDSFPAASLVPTYDSYRFLWCWVGAYFLFFTLAATKLPNYILPLCAPLAVLTARWLERWRRGEFRPPAWALGGGLAGFAAAGIVTAMGLALAGRTGAAWLPRTPHFAGLEFWALLGAFPILGAAAALWCLWRRQRGALIVGILAAGFLLIGPLAAWGIAALDAYKAPRPLVEQAGACQVTEDIRVGTYALRYLPSLTFYCQRTVRHHDREEDALDFLRWKIPVFLFLPEEQWQQLQSKVSRPCQVVGRHRDLYHNCTVVVVRNSEE
jgi:4-amino-4-deoxy-L-arabinose transferase-like glycosyltransferase